ncbi:hypothetical protein [Cyanobium sp. ATX-6F1]|uniref:hypothetical protein n=1 Tax=Cyanobium sp. ATX-6F1 TaxID=3137388 RepID=UPI0039BE8967
MTKLLAHYLEFIRCGKSVACQTPPSMGAATNPSPWAALRGSGVLHAEPEDSVLEAHAFDALR